MADSLIRRIDRGLARFEAAVVVLDLLVMLTLSAVQLVLHKVFDTGFEWADIVVRQMVMWIGFVGGALAAHEGRHIAIDLLGRLLPPRRAAAVQAVTSSAAAVIVAFMFVASLRFVQEELHNEVMLVGALPSWPFKLVIPFSFGAVIFHFLVAAWTSLQIARGLRPPRAEEWAT